MAFSPGRNVGRVSIRVVPDTTKLRAELRRDLDRIARTTTMKIRVDGVRLDNAKIRASIQQQMQEFKGLDLEAKVEVIVDRARLKKNALRKSIQAQFDQLEDIRVSIMAEIRNVERFEKQVRDMVQRANRNKVSIGVAAHTAAAAAQMRYVSRPRFVDLLVRVNKTSVTAALASLAALSGARLSWKWIDDLVRKLGDLDKNLPSLLGWTTGITSLVAGLFGATSGLVGIGQGLVSILPALLVVPGLFINALGSLTALIVALRNAGTELSVLKTDMHELGDIINETFWTRARKPIIDLVQGLMPQLRVAFHDLSEGMGDFTAAMSQAFGEELANGRLESIFRGIADGWRVLGSGAKGFAGALVSLSQIAATYTPRLAGWFVRQANTFDAWLESIANDGRLGTWMEGAIDSMYDLWDATTGVAGVLTGIWRAADAAGGGGLKGFATLMQDWKRITNGADFQRGLTAIFRGANVAMSAFGGAVRAIGRLVADLDGAFERFIGSSGTFLAGLIGGAANALNRPSVGAGLDGLSSGLLTSLERILPSLGPIANTFGNFLGLLGDLAATVLPSAAGVLAALMPSLDALIDAIGPILPDLADAVSDIATTLGPSIQSFVEAVAPSLAKAFQSLADILVDATPTIASLVEALGPGFAAAIDLLVGALEGISSTVGVDAWGTNPNQIALDFIGDPSMLTDATKLLDYVEQIRANGGIAGALLEGATGFWRTVRDWIDGLNFLRDNAPAIIQQTIMLIPAAIEAALMGLGARIESAGTAIGAWLTALPERLRGLVAGAGAWLTDTGSQIIAGLISGLQQAVANIGLWFSGLPNLIRGSIGGSGNWLFQVGVDMIQGLIRGIQSIAASVARAARSVVEGAVNAATSFLNINSPSRVTRDRIGKPWGEGVAVGIQAQRKNIVDSARKTISPQGIPIPAFGGLGSDGDGRARGGDVHVTMPLLPGETPAEQRDNVVRVLRNV